ncbi:MULTISPECIES: ROK family transcriptional regulator [Dactylosporangium]|uniref:Transcriptional regulator n=2 Tax=Dactylosporangium TaxID=35753 RepID=A0A9W6KHA4_9ACTN|nr:MULTISPECIES: ROK family transcriptional regulator [Dactylosporangium]UAC00710.1 ROK family transcriptional regulator [Dactylosporangium vinaceum]UWZ48269.1 ROK family transcriptional regulator [Dactylosporangium matsuzakiense]GLL01508.1 transcriptional regulator [Dactylosporangium matsuzakiense]
MADQVITGTDLSRLRELNSLTVVRALRDQPPATVTELAKLTGLSRPAVDVIAQGLVTGGWATVVEPGASSVVGRPARRYRFRATAGHVIGVDVGGHKVLALLADLDGDVTHTARRSVAADAGPAERLAALDQVLAEILRESGKTAEDIWAVSVGVTGPVDASGRTTLFSPMPGWDSVDLPAHLSDRFACPIIVENDCKLAALAERWQGAASDANDIVFLLAGMRMGAGLIIDGVLRRGYGGAAGEIGALKAVRWLTAPEHLQRCPGVPATVGPDDAAAWVFNAARAGNRDARTAVTRYVKDIAIGTAALVLALDPQVVVFGGGFSRSADLVLEPLQRELAKLCLRVPDVRASTLGADSVALGALRLALNEVDRRLFTAGLSAPIAPRRE